MVGPGLGGGARPGSTWRAGTGCRRTSADGSLGVDPGRRGPGVERLAPSPGRAAVAAAARPTAKGPAGARMPSAGRTARATTGPPLPAARTAILGCAGCRATLTAPQRLAWYHSSVARPNRPCAGSTPPSRAPRGSRKSLPDVRPSLNLVSLSLHCIGRPRENCCPDRLQQVRARARTTVDPPLLHRDGRAGQQLGPLGSRRPARYPQPDRRGRPAARGGVGRSTGPPSPSASPCRRPRASRWDSSEGRVNPTHTMVTVNHPQSRPRGGSPSARTWCPSRCSAPPTGTGWPTRPTGRHPTAAACTTGIPASSITEEGASRLGHPADPHPGDPGRAARRGPGQGPRAPGARLRHHARMTSMPPSRSPGSPSSRVTSCWSAPARPPTSPCPGDPASGGTTAGPRSHRLYLADPGTHHGHGRMVPRP